MILAAVVAMAFGAKAEWSLYASTSYFGEATGDLDPGDSKLTDGYYKVYIIQNAGADINAVAAYVNGNTVGQIAGEAKAMYDGFSNSRYSDSYYQYFASMDDMSPQDGIDINPVQAYLVVFYGEPSETMPSEFYVIGNKSDSELSFDDQDSKCAKSGWQTYTGPSPTPVPEPTSGLMMLIGLAGLALKRKVQG